MLRASRLASVGFFSGRKTAVTKARLSAAMQKKTVWLAVDTAAAERRPSSFMDSGAAYDVKLHTGAAQVIAKPASERVLDELQPFASRCA